MNDDVEKCPAISRCGPLSGRQVDTGTRICVYLAANAIEGNLIRGLLESEDITVELRGENLAAYPGVPRISETRVYVAAAQQTAARALIDRYEQRHAEQRQWRCESCGETNTAAFETCWQCRGPMPQNGGET